MAETPTPDAWRATLRRRVLWILVAFVAWTAGIEYRLVYLQVYRHDEYVAKARRQQMRTLTLAAIRGDIVDRQNRVLATSADVESVYAVPTEIDEKDTKATATALCHALKDCTPDFLATLTDRLSKEERAFQFVKRHVSPEEAAAVRALKLDGIGFMNESHRFYPNRDLLGPVLGYVGLDNNGLAGIEKKFEETIRGKDGKVIVVTDAKRHAFDRLERPPTAGASIELTIDSVLQHDVERELARGVIENRAEDGVAVVMDPWTGEILAMASYPDYNPNVAGQARSQRAAQPCGRGNLRARLHVQDGDGVGGARRETRHAGHADRLRARVHRHRSAEGARHPSARRAHVHGRHRPVEQRRRDQDGIQGGRGSARAIRPALRIRHGARCRICPPSRAAGSGRSSPTTRWRRSPWAIRSASRQCRWRQPSARLPTAAC